MNIKMKTRGLLATALLISSVVMAPQASAVIITTDLSNPTSIPGLTGFQTFGDMMDGMSVTATFSGGLTQTLSWADTGFQAGGVSGLLGGSSWSLSVTGDTYASNAWTMNTGALTLTNLKLDGSTGLTVLDTTFDNLVGTAGSAAGADISTGTTARYSSAVAIGAAAPVGDIFHVVDVSFLPNGVQGIFTFRQDTDNDSRFSTVPEPTILALLGVGLLGMTATRRRKNAA
ncbi:MAG: PEP-CTERM sorting domain-containing protein [Gammaproteobacteria bacterium]|nr:PEP-CTERM sorting domain-containing protein [Gammaproteobacteria bacterium]